MTWNAASYILDIRSCVTCVTCQASTKTRIKSVYDARSDQFCCIFRTSDIPQKMISFFFILLPSLSLGGFTPRKLTVKEVKEGKTLELDSLFTPMQSPLSQNQVLTRPRVLKHLPKGTNMDGGVADSIR